MRAGMGDAHDYPAISDYAVIGDCSTVALLSREGSVDWLCLPYFSGRPMFAALLDHRKGGCFRVKPRTEFHCQRRYVDDTNVLETTFETEQGTATITDCMTMLPYAEPPDVLTPQSELLRRVQVTRGTVELEVLFEPRPDFGRRPVRLHARSSGAFALRDRDLYLVFQCEAPLELNERADGVHGVVRLECGDTLACSLSFVQRDMGILPSLGNDAEQRLTRTCRWWKAWSDLCTFPESYRPQVMRSALVLKLLQQGLTGAMVAAPTTSLPEVMGGSRNWDYRFCWLRDAALTFQAFTDLGYRAEGEQFLGWLLHATRLSWPRLRVLYDTFGETHVHEQEIPELEGYRGSRPVRVGNAASAQLQLDVYGALIQAACDYVSRGGGLDPSEARLLAGFGEMICRCWDEPDSSIWEIRGKRRHYTYSKMMCWSGLDELLKLAEDGHLQAPREHFRKVRDDIARAIEEHGFSESRNSYVQTFDNDLPDASLLLAARHYRDAGHPRMAGTFDYVERELADGPLIHRYAPGSDGMQGEEGAFVMTSFWAVEYLALAGRVEEAEQRFQALAAMSSELGLYAEEIDPASGAALGNFPQAFSHLGLVTAAAALDQARSLSGRKHVG